MTAERHTDAGHEHELAEHNACLRALSQLQEFLHHELATCDEDAIRAHLAACDSCLETFDIEQTITMLVKRCHPEQQASADLRMRVMKLSVTMHDPQA
jgi:anti-sigma factor (TIGR02949 family)